MISRITKLSRIMKFVVFGRNIQFMVSPTAKHICMRFNNEPSMNICYIIWLYNSIRFGEFDNQKGTHTMHYLLWIKNPYFFCLANVASFNLFHALFYVQQYTNYSLQFYRVVHNVCVEMSRLKVRIQKFQKQNTATTTEENLHGNVVEKWGIQFILVKCIAL